MSWIYPVAGLWLALLLGLGAYLVRKKRLGGPLRALSIAIALLSLLLTLWWGFLSRS